MDFLLWTFRPQLVTCMELQTWLALARLPCVRPCSAALSPKTCHGCSKPFKGKLLNELGAGQRHWYCSHPNC
jgi:hypothetical protein